MFLHNFKYTFKTLFRNRGLIFWTVAFPVIMATFFHMAFADIIESDKLKVIDMAIVSNEEFENNILYKKTFTSLSDEKNKDRLFNITYTSKDKAKKLLEDDKIEGYLELKNNKPYLTFQANGINQTIIKYVVDEVHDTEKIFLMNADLDNSLGTISADIENYLNNNKVELKNIANSNLNYMMIEYYTLIAMTCLYAGCLGMVAIDNSLPYLKGNGKRITVSPTKKISIILSSLLAGYIVQLISLGLLFFYTICILNVDYGNHIGHIILLSLVGSIAGISLGVLVGAYIKASDNVKSGILIAITMAGCFLAGIMGVGMKYVIDKNLPLLNKINPANMITDGFYSLYYYTDFHRYWIDIISLLIFTLITIILSCNKIGRAKYDSI
ncbi:MAG: ABC transporter permease [Bacilli bacterium]|nr:ABC transporter permease [Bacilli bacterium]